MNAVLAGIATVIASAAVLTAALVFARSRDPLLAVKVLLDLLLAAGLVRLATDPTWSQLATAAAVVAIRKVTTLGLVRARRTLLENRT